MMTRTTTIIALAVMALVASNASAQTNDHFARQRQEAVARQAAAQHHGHHSGHYYDVPNHHSGHWGGVTTTNRFYPPSHRQNVQFYSVNPYGYGFGYGGSVLRLLRWRLPLLWTVILCPGWHGALTSTARSTSGDDGFRRGSLMCDEDYALRCPVVARRSFMDFPRRATARSVESACPPKFPCGKLTMTIRALRRQSC